MIEKQLNNFELYEIDGVLYSLEELRGFIETSKELTRKTERQTRFIKALKLDNSRTTIERNNAIDELHRIKQMSMFEFGNRYCNDESLEEDGKAFAKALLGGAKV